MGIIHPSKWQYDLLAHFANDHRNIIVKGESGIGKTLTCCIAALCHVNIEKSYPQALILCPTHEAAVCTSRLLSQVAINTKIKIGNAVKGSNGNILFYQNYGIDKCYFPKNVIMLVKLFSISVNLDKVLDCHVLVGSPKEMVSFKLMRLFNIEQVTLCVVDDADAVVTTNLIIDNIIKPLKMCRKVLISSTMGQTKVNFMVPYIAHSNNARAKIFQGSAICKTNHEKLVAILTAYKAIAERNLQGIVFFEVKYSRFVICMQFITL